MRNSQGVTQAKNTIDASTTPARDRRVIDCPAMDRLPPFARRYQAHNPAAGRNDSSDVLVSAAIPHSSPNLIQGNQPSLSSRVSASQKIVASSSADKLVSHTQRVHQNMTFGSKAHAHAEPTATFSEKIRRAIKKIGMQVKAEKMLLMVSRTNADAFE